MSGPNNVTAENHLAIFFDTNQAVAARPFGIFLTEVQRIARLQKHFGPSATIEIYGIGTGTIWVDFAIQVGAAVTAGAIGALAASIATRMRGRNGRLPEAVAELFHDNGVIAATIVTVAGTITIDRHEVAPPSVSHFDERGRPRRITRKVDDLLTADEEAYLDAGFDPIVDGSPSEVLLTSPNSEPARVDERNQRVALFGKFRRSRGEAFFDSGGRTFRVINAGGLPPRTPIDVNVIAIGHLIDRDTSLFELVEWRSLRELL